MKTPLLAGFFAYIRQVNQSFLLADINILLLIKLPGLAAGKPVFRLIWGFKFRYHE